jgi:hypothetical protein
MTLPNVFTKEVSGEVIGRIENLRPDTQRLWGKMDVGQMLAHLCVSYEMVYEPEKHKKPNVLMGLVLKLFVKRIVTNEKPYGKNSPTAPAFKMTTEKVFLTEKARLIEYIEKTCNLGENEFDGKGSMSFGKMNKTEWNNMLYKHLDHHLKQFGV